MKLCIFSVFSLAPVPHLTTKNIIIIIRDTQISLPGKVDVITVDVLVSTVVSAVGANVGAGSVPVHDTVISPLLPINNESSDIR